MDISANVRYLCFALETPRPSTGIPTANRRPHDEPKMNAKIIDLLLWEVTIARTQYLIHCKVVYVFFGFIAMLLCLTRPWAG